MEGIIFIGLQASGKSGFYKLRFFNSHVRISMDLLKTRHREMKILKTCLETSQKVIIDNTNPTIQERKRYIDEFKERNYRVVGYYFESKLENCLSRNRMRNSEERVPDIGILGTYKKLQIPSLEEGFDVLYKVKLENETFIVEDWKDEIRRT